MVAEIMEWVSITALLMVVSWRPFASYQKYLWTWWFVRAPSWGSWL